MFKPNSFIKATATTLATCMLMACGGDDSSNDDAKYVLSLNSAEAAKTGVMGKTVYSVSVKDDDGNEIYGVTPTLKPMMAMNAGHHHSSPHTGCTETNDLGNSDCTVYFIMASAMNGESMGTWTVDIALEGAETLSFNPDVTMPMNETVRVNLKGVDDKVGETPRIYNIFNNSAMASNGNRNIELFISSKETGMSFPALATNTTLSEGTDDVLSVDTVDVLVSTDKDAAPADWTTATSKGNGIWSANVENYTNTFYVKLSVNSEAKMSGTLDYATFEKTSSMMKMAAQ